MGYGHGNYGHFWTINKSGEKLPKEWGLQSVSFIAINHKKKIPDTKVVYRWYNNKKHFWTDSTDPNKGEGRNLVAQGYHMEGPHWRIFKHKKPGTVPLYRWYDGRGNHFWTRSKTGELLPKPRFHRERVQGYVFPPHHPMDKTLVKVYRFRKGAGKKYCCYIVKDGTGSVYNKKEVYARNES